MLNDTYFHIDSSRNRDYISFDLCAYLPEYNIHEYNV